MAVAGSNLIAGTCQGIFRSTDLGSTWDTTFRGMYVIAFLASNGILYASNDGTNWPYYDHIYRSKDSGVTWKPAGFSYYTWGDSIFDNVFSLASIGDVILGGTQAEGIYRSKDGGSTWSRSDSGLTDFGIYALISDNANLFAGTDSGGVFLSTDTGLSWHSINDNLPYRNIQSLVIHDGYLFAGTGGNGVCWRRPLSQIIALGSVSKPHDANTDAIYSYPNPFSQSAKISFSLAQSGYADVSIVNVLGAEVAQLYAGEVGAGNHSFTWDAGSAAPGNYWCIVRTSEGVMRIGLLRE